MKFFKFILAFTPAFSASGSVMAAFPLSRQYVLWNDIAVRTLAASCIDPDLSPNGHRWIMWASCERKVHEKPWRCTRLDLDKDELIPRKSGRLSEHCGSCRLGSGNKMLGCVCKERPNTITWVALDDLITNDDGYLQCFDNAHRGTETC
ncbi:hypothetical protein AAE478_008544 [Parahypoxylon ruwenzoriense]